MNYASGVDRTGSHELIIQLVEVREDSSNLCEIFMTNQKGTMSYNVLRPRGKGTYDGSAPSWYQLLAFTAAGILKYLYMSRINRWYMYGCDLYYRSIMENIVY